MSATDGTLASLGRPDKFYFPGFRYYLDYCVIIRGHKIIRLTTFVNILRDQLSSLSHVRGHTGERRTQRLSHTRGGDGRCGGATHYQGRWRRGRGGAGGGGEAKRGGGQGNGQGRRRG